MNERQLAVNREAGSRLRVLVDARKILHGGIGVYTRNLLAGLAERDDVAVSALVPPNLGPKLTAQPWYDSVAWIEERARSYSLTEMLRLAARIDQSAFDLYHMPHYVLPYGFTIPVVITVHDLIHIHHPQRFFYPLVSRALLRSSLKRATRVLAVSRATAAELQAFSRRQCGAADKVRMVPNAIDPFFLRRVAGGLSSQSRESYLLGIFSMSKPHKGLADLLRVFAAVRRAAAGLERPELRLVVAGYGVEGSAERSLAESLGIAGQILWLGRVEDSELVSLYAGAEALIVSSLSEGFCLPVIEAQAQGTPVVSRPVPAVREILTDNDICCRDFSEAALLEGIVSLLERGAKGKGRVPRSVNQAHLDAFDRGHVADQVVQVYREAIEAGVC